MKAILLITDSEAMRDYERALVTAGQQGYTVMPAIAGAGRTGLKTGDRVHPGSSSLLLAVAEQGRDEAVLESLRATRDAGGYSGLTRIWTFDMAEVA
jgi:hypothetical protein